MHWNSHPDPRTGHFRGVFPLILAGMLVSGPLCVAGPPDTAVAATAGPSQQDESAVSTPADDTDASTDEPHHRNELVRGRVVWLAEALEEKFGISTVSEVSENALALLTTDGELLPIVENVRGRAFRKDKRLREMEVDLLVRRYEKQPLIQILRVYEIDDGRHYEVDYWCDICAITMFETGPCSCCQDDNRLRKRLVEEKPTP